MDTNRMQLWEKTLTIIKGEMSEVSFNTWIKSCKPLSIDDNTIKISVPNSFTQDILEKRYKDLIANSIKSICSKLYKIEFKILSDIQNDETTTTNTQKKKEQINNYLHYPKNNNII